MTTAGNRFAAIIVTGRVSGRLKVFLADFLPDSRTAPIQADDLPLAG